MRECLKKRGRKIGNHATFEQRGSQPWPPSFPPVPLPAPVPRHSKSPSFCSPLSFLSPLGHSHVSLYVIPAKAGIQSLFPSATRRCWGLGRPGVLGHSSGFPLKTAGMTRGGTAGMTGGKLRERLYVIPAKAGIQSLFPLRHALVLGAWPAGRPGPFLWIPAKNCGNDKGGHCGKARGETAGTLVCHSRESGNPESFPPAPRAGAGGLAGRGSWAIPLDSR